MEQDWHKKDGEKSRDYVESVTRRPIFQWLIGLLGFIIVVMIAIPSQLGARRVPWQSRAKGTLRAIGASQTAYSGTNSGSNYGSFEALKADMYIAEGYTLGNMIENYSMTWEAYNSSTVEGEPTVHRFKVIAYPRDTRPGFLNTFCVTEDQVVRVYIPDGEYEFEAIYHWDPIL